LGLLALGTHTPEFSFYDTGGYQHWPWPSENPALLTTTSRHVRIIRTPVRAPCADASAGRFVGSIRSELLDRLLIIDQRHAAAVLREYQRHDNHHRPHRALGQAAPLRPLPRSRETRRTASGRRARFGGSINEYQQVA
jgi:putative transposase